MKTSPFYKYGKHLCYRYIYGGRLNLFQYLSLRLWQRLYGRIVVK